jgi:hypothetical protein
LPHPRGVGPSTRMSTRPDGVTLFALGCVVIGWFLMNTLVITLGSIQHGVRFFDMGAVIADPMRLFFGVDATFQRILFGLLCLSCVVAVLVTQRLGRHGWLSHLAPLALMLVTCVLLYSRISGEFYIGPGDVGFAGDGVVHFADDLIRKGHDLMSRHISIAAGGYIATIGSTVLAIRALMRRRGL